MADLPDRRKHIHFTQPWLHSSHSLLLRADSISPDRSYAGRIALFKMPLHVRLVKETFPEAQVAEFPEAQQIIKEVCRGTATAGFLEGRTALTALREKPSECASVALRVQTLPALTLQHSVASTFEAAGAAEMIRHEIGNMFRDGTLATTMAKYSYYGLDDSWATYDLMEAAERDRRRAWGISVLAMAVALALWLASFLQQRQRAEARLRKSEERFRALFSQAAVGIAQTSPDGKWLLLNSRFCEILDYSQDELRGKTFLDVTHPDDRQVSLTAIRRILAGEISSWSTEKRYIRKDGRTVWARLFTSLVWDEENRPQYFISVVEDITEKVQAERTLRDTQRRLALAQSAAHLGIWDRDLETNVISIFGEYANLYGLAPDRTTLTHEEWLSVIHPADRDQMQVLLRESLERKHVFDGEFRVVWPDGSLHWLLAKGTVFLDDSGRPIRAMGVSVDISERKQADAALRESEERFRSMADSAPVMIWVSGSDKQVTFFNKSWLNFTGRTLEQELGNGWATGVHPDDLDHFFTAYSASFEARRNFQIEYRLRRFDGEYRSVLDNGTPLYRAGEFTGYIGSCIDVTEQKLVQDRLRTGERRLTEAQRLAKVGSWERYFEGDAIYWSDEMFRIFGLPIGPPLHFLAFLSYVHADDREKIKEANQNARAIRTPVIVEYRITRPDGEMRFLRSFVEVIGDRPTEPVRIAGATQDITEQKRAEATLRRTLDEFAHLNRVAAMGELTASMAHEINQPLAAILSNAQAASRFLSSVSPDLAEVRACLTDIITDDKRAGQVINRLRGLLKKGEPQTSMVDLNEVVTDVIRLVRNDALLRQAELIFEPLPSLPPVLGDRIQVYQVVLNLIVNGLEAVTERPPGDRRLLVRTGAAGGVELTVEDSGNGIAESDLTRVFEPFFSTKPKGLGMGLSISRSIVQAHGGRLWAENTASGAMFRCLLPVAQPTIAITASQAP
jgi:PAS domain S-box-containing protein